MRRSALSFVFAAFIVGAPAYASAQDESTSDLRAVVDAGLAAEDVAVKSWSLRAAALLGDASLRTVVEAELENASAPVRISAATGLLESGQSAAAALDRLTSELVDGDASARTMLLQRILPVLKETTHRIVVERALAAATDGSLYETLIRALAYQGRGELYALLSAQSAASAERRELVVRHIVASRRSEGAEVARAWMQHRDADVQAHGADIAMALGTAEARAALELLLDASDSALAQRVGLYLARHGNMAGLQRARDLGLNPSMPEELRLQALELVRDRGGQLLTMQQIDTILAEPAVSPAMRTRAFEALGATRSPEAVDRLRRMYDGLFAEEREDALAGIGFTGQGDFIAPLAELLRSNSHQSLRMGAARALGRLGGDEGARPLAAQLNFEPDAQVKFVIMEALSYTGSSLAAQPIANEFIRQDRDTTLAGLDALQRIGGTGVAAQVEAISNSFRDPSVRWQAILTLLHLDADLGRIRLLQALDRPPEGFRDDLNAFADALQAEVDETLLRHVDSTIRDAALMRVLLRADGGYSVLRPMLLGATITPDVRRQAISVVTARRSPDDMELLQRLAGDVDRGVRLQAYGAIAQMADPANEAFLQGLADTPDLAVRAIGTYGLLKLANPTPPPPSTGAPRRRR
jgi:hypothetical protein